MQSVQAGSSSTYEGPNAPERVLPSTAFYSVEYPGYVKVSSVPLAVHNLGGQTSLDRAFKRNTTKSEALVELNLRPTNPFAHPVPGDVVGTNNILLKVTKRIRKRVAGKEVPEGGEFVAEAVGTIPKTVRFRSELHQTVWQMKATHERSRHGRLPVHTQHV